MPGHISDSEYTSTSLQPGPTIVNSQLDLL